MPVTIDYLKNRTIYQEKNGTLAERVDFCWSIYSSNKDIKLPNEELFKLKKEALLFLIYALDIRDPQDINVQLIKLMEERKKVKDINPGYIPGKSASLPFNPAVVIPSATPLDKKNSSSSVAKAISNKELLDVNLDSKNLDLDRNTIFLTEQERAERRVIISNGVFKKNGEPFDTSEMHSHDKKGFAAFTLNSNGELSVFIHNRMRDRFAHSSMNAGAPVVAAGEIKIQNGVLKAITTHSGHYRPSLFNVYRLLEHFTKHGIDINEAKIVSFNDPSESLSKVESEEVYYPAYHRQMYETPANQIYNGMLDVINFSINSVSEQIKTYQKEGLLTTIFKLKDKLFGSLLTEERSKIAIAFQTEIKLFKEGLKSNLKPEELISKKNELNNIISKYETENNNLSMRNNKSESSGRLSNTMSDFKSQLKELKKSGKAIEIGPEQSDSMKNIS